MKIYTRTGDAGDTSLFGGGRVPKDDARVTAYGTVDELNACLGWAVARVADGDVRDRLERVQHDLFALGSLLAVPPSTEGRPRPKGLPKVPMGRIKEMEAWIDAADAELPELRAFILPGGTEGAAVLHVARTVCRRAERAVVTLRARDGAGTGVMPSASPEGATADDGGRDSEIATITYLNRLSDLLFTFARVENLRAGVADVAWEKE